MKFTTPTLGHRTHTERAFTISVVGDHANRDSEEALVTDTRAALSPAQMVERKLASLLHAPALPISQIMTARRPMRCR